jgi:hypothetical protein
VNFVFEHLLNETEKYLERRHNEPVSIKQAWTDLCREAKRRNFPVPKFADFECLLDADHRFECISQNGFVAGFSEEEISEYEDMEKLGLLENIFVRLKIAAAPVEDDEADNENLDLLEEYDQLLDKELVNHSSRKIPAGVRPDKSAGKKGPGKISQKKRKK